MQKLYRGGAKAQRTAAEKINFVLEFLCVNSASLRLCG
jgi:hypothetical protein